MSVTPLWWESHTSEHGTSEARGLDLAPSGQYSNSAAPPKIPMFR